jgi:hypothetical protein
MMIEIISQYHKKIIDAIINYFSTNGGCTIVSSRPAPALVVG